MKSLGAGSEMGGHEAVHAADHSVLSRCASFDAILHELVQPHDAGRSCSEQVSGSQAVGDRGDTQCEETQCEDTLLHVKRTRQKIREISKEIEQLFKDFLAEMEVDRCLSPPLLLPPDSDGVSCSSSEDASPLLSPRSDAGLRSRSPLSGEASAASLSPHSDVGIRRRADTDRSPIDEELTASSMGACSVSADCSFPLQDRSEDAHHLKAA
eukprot:TRINITY_DN26967_c1_g1_i3.p1 TRINITY_DN26967_c1_g1~~TRINITY_DN26967_c1_g1_i3.p1  ORF type:complete len:245 (-),score=22.25 TRINITY_DN26967_c1_g1_i3:129-761(-)